jgi:hypothetical protein
MTIASPEFVSLPEYVVPESKPMNGTLFANIPDNGHTFTQSACKYIQTAFAVDQVDEPVLINILVILDHVFEAVLIKISDGIISH